MVCSFPSGAQAQQSQVWVLWLPFTSLVSCQCLLGAQLASLPLLLVHTHKLLLWDPFPMVTALPGASVCSPAQLCHRGARGSLWAHSCVRRCSPALSCRGSAWHCPKQRLQQQHQNQARKNCSEHQNCAAFSVSLLWQLQHERDHQDLIQPVA